MQPRYGYTYPNYGSPVHDTVFRPMIDAISVKMKNRRQKVAGSWKQKIPVNTVPMAPIPVQTAYAVPIGRLSVAFANRPILMIVKTKNPAIHPIQGRPSTDFARPRQ